MSVLSFDIEKFLLGTENSLLELVNHYTSRDLLALANDAYAALNAVQSFRQKAVYTIKKEDRRDA
jgi:hypothetical protein